MYMQRRRNRPGRTVLAAAPTGVALARFGPGALHSRGGVLADKAHPLEISSEQARPGSMFTTTGVHGMPAVGLPLTA